MTLDEAVQAARKVQDDLDSGRLTVPYPPEVRKTIMQCCGVFMDYATDSEKATALVARLQAPEPAEAELPW